MPSIVGLNSSSQASRKVISNLGPQTAGATATAAANLRPFTSALDTPTPPLTATTTALRRRDSDGSLLSSRDSSTRHRNHRHHPKSPSMDSPTEPHPLRRSGTTSRTARYDDDDRGNTRPRLTRLLSPSEPVLASSRSPDDPLPQPETTKPHRTVLAHEVLPNDTLAGVALRYGISVTELRRANQLWASDSIHLRQVLYVPLDKAHHADLETVASLLAQRDDSEQATVPAAGPRPPLDPRTSDSSPFVRRIPSASLSFFPPPSSMRSSTPPPAAGPPFAVPVSSTSPFHSRSHSPANIGTHSRGGGPNLAPGLRAANALSSLFSVLPINASTRDEIMSRLSIESVSVSNSTTGTASDESEHELTAVPKTPKPRRADAPTALSAPLAVHAHARRKDPAHTWLSERSSEPYSGYGEPHHPRDVEQIALASSPIHTMQMQPAPTMQLPGSIARSPPKGIPPPPPNDPHDDVWRTSGGDHRRTR